MSDDALVETLFFTASHIGLVDESCPFTVMATSGKPGFGSVLILGLVANDEALIQRACFKAYGPPALIASAEYLCRELEGQNLASLESICAEDIKHRLEIDAVHFPELVRLAAVYHEALKKLKAQYANLL